MDIPVDSQATVDIAVHGCPQLPEGQNRTSPVTPTSSQETQCPLIRIHRIFQPPHQWAAFKHWLDKVVIIYSQLT